MINRDSLTRGQLNLCKLEIVLVRHGTCVDIGHGVFGWLRLRGGSHNGSPSVDCVNVNLNSIVQAL